MGAKSRRRESEYRTLVNALRPVPVDSEHSGARVGNHNQDRVAWSANIDRGVRVQLELRVTGDGDVYVESFSATDVLNDGEFDSQSRVMVDPGDVPVRGEAFSGGTLSEDSDRFVNSDGSARCYDGDEDTAPDGHGSDSTDPWAPVVGSILRLPDMVRLSLVKEMV